MKHHIVIPLHHRGGALGNNTELRLTVRSIERHFTDEHDLTIVGRVFPDKVLDRDRAGFIESGGLKSALADASREFPDGFFWWYDDCVLLRDQSAEQLKVTTANRDFLKSHGGWASMLRRVEWRLRKSGIPAVDYSRPHGPYWFDRGMVQEGFADWPKMAGKFPWETWILSKRRWPSRTGVTAQYYGPFSPPGGDKVLVNWNDRGCTPELLGWLSDRFREPCALERQEVAA